MKRILLKFGILLFGFIIFSSMINAQQVIITDAAGFNLTVDGILDINADLINNSSNTVFLGTSIFSGTTEHDIGGNATIEFANLELNNSEGIRLSTDISVTGNLNLLAGVIHLLNNNITLGSNASISGNLSSTVMVVADSSGQFKREINGTGTYLFPVGDTSGIIDYSPVSLSFNSGTFSNAVVAVNLKNKKHPENNSVSNYLNKYWTISETGISDFICTAVFTYSNDDIVGDESNLYGAQWDGNQWTMLNQASLNQFNGTVNSFSDFTAGEKKLLSVEDLITPEDIEILVEGNKIIIRSDLTNLERAEIYNLSGQLIYSKDLTKNTINEFNFNASSNYYIVRVYSKKQSISKKIFKN